jgi:glycosyltransferase involved in cell wall biosynthesis
VVLLRGHHANPWDLRPWEVLKEKYDISYVLTASNVYEAGSIQLDCRRVRSVRDLFPRGRAGSAAAYILGERYFALESLLRGADIVHSAEIGTWFSDQAAALKPKLGFRLVLTVWETIPTGRTFRWPRERRYRARVLRAADLFLPTTNRARSALLLEGANAERVRVCPPGIDVDHFASSPSLEVSDHVVLSIGRLVWEKGHQDVLRALALLRRDRQILGDAPLPRVVIVGSGPAEGKLRSFASDLGLPDRVEILPSLPYDEMPAVYAKAACLVLASLPTQLWEEQFGMVLAEAMAAGVPLIVSDSGAIPEVVPPEVKSFAAGDWIGLAHLLADGPLRDPPGTRISYDAGLIQSFSRLAAAERVAAAYERVLAETPVR